MCICSKGVKLNCKRASSISRVINLMCICAKYRYLVRPTLYIARGLIPRIVKVNSRVIVQQDPHAYEYAGGPLGWTPPHSSGVRARVLPGREYLR